MSSADNAPITGACAPAGFGAPIRHGGLILRGAQAGEWPDVMRLRGQVFRGDATVDDSDSHDADALHLWIGRADDPDLCATARLHIHPDADGLMNGYTGARYDLSALSRQPGPVIELGRVCMSAAPDIDTATRTGIFMLLWAGIARLVQRYQITRLIGCASFTGQDVNTHRSAFEALSERHIGPENLRPGQKAPQTALLPRPAIPPAAQARQQVPPLLRTYLGWGGWVSDHLVIDPDLNTCHVFICVDMSTMPPARIRAFTRLAGDDSTNSA